jgi:hypothetical protein
MHILFLFMGCIETKTNPPLVVNTTTPSVPIYVKSALKKSRANGRGKSGKLTSLKNKSTIANKSVNFDENVRVKLRTPTPKDAQYQRSSTKQTSHVDDEDNYDQASSVSSLDEDISNEQIKLKTTTITPTLQRNQPNSFWYKNNSIGITSSTNTIKEKPHQIPLPSVNMMIQSPEDPNVPVTNRFRVRRKIQHTDLPQASSPVQSSSAPVQSSPVPVQRPLPNKNTILIEHHTTLPNGGTSPKPAYYAFSRRTVDNATSTNKKKDN